MGQLAPGGTWTKSSLDTNDSEDQDRHVWALCLVESMPGGDARRRERKAVHTRGCDDDVGRGGNASSYEYNPMYLDHLPGYLPACPLAEW